MRIQDKFINATAEAILSTHAMKNFMDTLKDEVNIIDDENLDSLVDIIKATKTDISVSKSIYLKAFSTLGIESLKHLHMLNNAGWHNQDLLFHSKYLSTSCLDSILRSKRSKVLQNSVTMNDETVQLKCLKRIVESLDVYGEAIIYVEDLEQFDDEKIKVIEPYRHYEDNGVHTILTFLRTEEEDLQLTHYFDMLVITERGMTRSDLILTSLGDDVKLEVNEIESRKLSKLPIYKIKNDEGSSLDKIKVALAITDLTESVSAVEIKNSQFQIHLDHDYFTNNKVIRKDFYRVYRNTNGTLQEPLFKEFQPLLRNANYEAIKNSLKVEIADELAVSVQTIGFNGVSYTSATEAYLADQKSIETINDEKKQLQSNFNMFLEAFFPDKTIQIKEYFSSNKSVKVDFIQKANSFMSTKMKIDILHPELDEDARNLEVVLIKFEQGIPMTAAEEELALKEKIIPGEYSGS